MPDPCSDTQPVNWEGAVAAVALEPCARADDPLCWRAVFRHAPDPPAGVAVFYVGASLLAARAERLERAGFAAPMTRRALELLAAQLCAAPLPSEASGGR